MSQPDPTTPAKSLYFDAILTPNRSLPTWGFRLLLASMVVFLGSLGFAFAQLGAWPVAGFCGLEFVLVWGAFKLSYRSGRMYEAIRLDDETLTVSRVVPNRPVRSYAFQPSWVRVAIDDPPRHDSKLTLSSHGRTISVGSFLTPRERVELADALRQAIEVWRNPVRA
jgi:uncharacterized membrane protein